MGILLSTSLGALSPLQRTVVPRGRLGLEPIARGSWSFANARALARISREVYSQPSTASSRLRALGAKQVKLYESENIQGVVASSPHNIVVAFPGTAPHFADPRDWLTNLNMLMTRRFGGHVHQGFSSALDLVWPSMRSDVEALLKVQKRPVFLTGHSMGGALATLAGFDLAQRGVTPWSIYSFAAPQVGDGAFAQAFDAKLGARTHRVVAAGDMLGSFRVLGYDDVGREYYVDGSETVKTQVSSLTRMWADLSNIGAMYGNAYAATLAAHKMPNYQAKLEAANRVE